MTKLYKPKGWPDLIPYLVVKDAIKHGAKSCMNLDDRFWGDRMCVIMDIEITNGVLLHV